MKNFKKTLDKQKKMCYNKGTTKGKERDSMKEMKMKMSFAEKFMDCLWELYMDAYADPHASYYAIGKVSNDAQEWAKNTFIKVCSEFETPEKRWDITP